MKTSRTFLVVLGGFLFAVLVAGQYTHYQKKEAQMRKYFSLILNEKKSLENHLQYLEKREKQLFSRLSQAEEKINNINR